VPLLKTSYKSISKPCFTILSSGINTNASANSHNNAINNNIARVGFEQE
jgi:hypothetical protein